jgi:hypothetical protein
MRADGGESEFLVVGVHLLYFLARWCAQDFDYFDQLVHAWRAENGGDGECEPASEPESPGKNGWPIKSSARTVPADQTS